MRLQNDICNITISVDETYAVGSADNKPYDRVINPRPFGRGDFYKVFRVEIELFHERTDIALVGDFNSCAADCAVLDGEVLTVLQNDAAVQIQVKDGSLLRYKQLDCFGCNYGIYKVEQGYLIYGEVEIIMLDFDFNKKWTFSGRDIFVSMSGKKAFELCGNSVKLYDFEGNFYEIDFNGRLIV